MARQQEKQTKRPEGQTEPRQLKRGGPEEPAGKPERTTPEKEIPQGAPGEDRNTPDPGREFDL